MPVTIPQGWEVVPEAPAATPAPSPAQIPDGWEVVPEAALGAASSPPAPNGKPSGNGAAAPAQVADRAEELRRIGAGEMVSSEPPPQPQQPPLQQPAAPLSPAASILRRYQTAYPNEIPPEKWGHFWRAKEAFAKEREREGEHRVGGAELDPWLNSVKMPTTYADAKVDSIDEAMLMRQLVRESGQADSGAFPYLLERIPFARAGKSIVNFGKLASAVKNVNANKATPSDWNTIAYMVEEAQASEDRGTARKIFDLVSAIPAFGVEFAATAGAYSAGRAVATKAAENVIGGAATSAIGRLAVGTLSRTVGVAAHTAANPQLIAESVAQKMVPEFHLDPNDAKAVGGIVVKDDPSFAEALWKGAASAGIEVGSERGGAALGWMGKGLAKVPGAARMAAVKAAVVNRFLRAHTVPQLQETLKQVGWNGTFGEIFEERLGEVARGATGIEKDYGTTGQLLTNDPKGWEQLGIEAAAFAVPGVAGEVGARIAGVPTGPEAPGPEAQPPPPPIPPSTPPQAPPQAPPQPPAAEPEGETIPSPDLISKEPGIEAVPQTPLPAEQVERYKGILAGVSREALERIRNDWRESPDDPRQSHVLELIESELLQRSTEDAVEVPPASTPDGNGRPRPDDGQEGRGADESGPGVQPGRSGDRDTVRAPEAPIPAPAPAVPEPAAQGEGEGKAPGEPQGQEAAGEGVGPKPGDTFTIPKSYPGSHFKVLDDGRLLEMNSHRLMGTAEEVLSHYRSDEVEWDAPAAGDTVAPVPPAVAPSEQPPSPFRRQAQEAIGAVPALKGAAVEVDDAAKTARVALPDGRATTIHFDADADLTKIEDALRTQGDMAAGDRLKGFYVYERNQHPDAKGGDIYLRTGATAEAINHEAAHWLEDIGVVTADEVGKLGGREAFAEKYSTWAGKGAKKGSRIFQRVRTFLQNLLGRKGAPSMEEVTGRVKGEAGTVAAEATTPAAEPPAAEGRTPIGWDKERKSYTRELTTEEWELESHAQEIAEKRAKKLGSPVGMDVPTVASRAFAHAMDTYDPAKAKAKGMEKKGKKGWVEYVVNKWIGGAVEQQAKIMQGLGPRVDETTVAAKGVTSEQEAELAEAEAKGAERGRKRKEVKRPQKKVEPPVEPAPEADAVEPSRGGASRTTEAQRAPESGEPGGAAEQAEQRADEAGSFRVTGAGRRGGALSREQVIAAFPGRPIHNLPGGKGWRVEVGDHHIDIELVAEVPLDFAALEARLGSTIPDDVRQTIRAAGSFSVVDENGRRLSGLGLVRLAHGMATDGTLRHEALHLARTTGMISEQEWNALTKRYSQPGRSLSQQEEDVAVARESFKSFDGLWSRIRAGLRRLLAKLGIGEVRGEDVFNLMDQAEFWDRTARRGGATDSYSIQYFAGEPLPGRPDLANPATDEGVRELVREVDEERNEAGKPPRRARAVAAEEAARRLEADYEGERKGLLDRAASGATFNEADTVMARTVLNDEGIEALKSGDPTRIQEVKGMVDAYRDIRAEQARALSLRDPLETPAQRRRRAILEMIYSSDNPQKLLDALREEEGIDVSDIDGLAENPDEAIQVVDQIATRQATYTDKAIEYWRNAILSAPTTHMANMIGNVSNATWYYTAERLMETGLNTLFRNPRGAQWGEYKHLLAGVLPGLTRGVANAFRSWRNERSALEQFTRGGKFQESPVAIKGRLGKVVRAMGYRPLLAADELAKTLVVNMEVGAQAYRTGKAAGLSGEQLQEHIQEQVDDIESAAWGRAMEVAHELTFQQEGTPLGRKVKKIAKYSRQQLKLLAFIMPFIETPVNIFEEGLRKSPLGAIELAIRWNQARKQVKDVGPAQAYAPLLRLGAQQAISTLALVILLASNDPDDPWITGSPPRKQMGKRQLQQRTHPPYSIKIGGKWYSYSRIEPFATAIGTTVDLIATAKSGHPVDRLWNLLVGQMESKTMLQGVSDMVEVIESPDTNRAAKWASKFAVSWLPNVIRSTGRAVRDTKPERRAWGKGGELWGRLGKRAIQDTELHLLADQPAYDIWGRPIPSSKSPAPKTDVAWRLFMPIYTTTEDVFVGDRLLMAWNRENPDEEWNPELPSPTYTFKGKQAAMSDEEYAEFLRDAGQLSQKRVANIFKGKNVDHPTAGQVKRLKTIIESSRDEARSRLRYRKLNPRPAPK